MHIGLVGYYGCGNLGDELFLCRWRQLFGNECHPVAEGEEITAYRACVIGGGDLIVNGTCSPRYWRPELLQVPCFVYGIGVCCDPSDEMAREYVQFLNQCAYVSARDEASANKLRAWGVQNVHEVEDLVWGYQMPDIRPVDDYRGWIGLALRTEYQYPDGLLRGMVKAVLDHSAGVHLMPLQCSHTFNSDYAMHAKLYEDFGNHPVRMLTPYGSPEFKAAGTGWCGLHVGTRLHGLLMALRNRRPILPLYWHWKTGNKFMELLRKLGLEGYGLTDCFTLQAFCDGLLAADTVSWEKVFERVSVLERKAVMEQEEFTKIVRSVLV